MTGVATITTNTYITTTRATTSGRMSKTVHFKQAIVQFEQ